MERNLKHVVNCFQISIFAYHKQCEGVHEQRPQVVNCFQISIFAYHKQLFHEDGYSIFRCELLSN